MCRHYSLLSTPSEVSPIHWKYGAISRLKDGEVIDNLLKEGYSTLSLGYIGLYETCLLVKGTSLNSEDGYLFATKVSSKLNKTIKKWKDETKIGFSLYATPSLNISTKLASKDIENFGSVEGITDKGYYSDSFYLDENVDIYQKIKFESEFQKLTLGGSILRIKINEIENNYESFKELINCIYNETLYVEFI